MHEYKGAQIFIDGAKQMFAVSFSDHENGDRVVVCGLAEDTEQSWARELDSQRDIIVTARIVMSDPDRDGGYERVYTHMKLASFVVGQDIAKHEDYPRYVATFVRPPKAEP